MKTVVHPRQPSSPAATPTHPAPIVKPIIPKHLFIPSIGVNTTIAPKPTEQKWDPFLRKSVPSFGVPDDLYTTTWWSSGPRPGVKNDMAVILGHMEPGNGYGVFDKLQTLKPGATIGVKGGKTTLKFRVTKTINGISKTDASALQRVLTAHRAHAQLALLTCYGDLEQSSESGRNTAVFAELVA